MKNMVVSLVLLLLLGAIPSLYSQPITLVTLGDSLTEGDGDEIGGGYPPRLLDLLSAGHPGSTLSNVGFSGHTSDDLINVQLASAVSILESAPSSHRAVALVWIGSNDLFGLYNYVCDIEYNNDFTACESAQFGYYRANLTTILTALDATGAEVYIALLDDQSRRPVMTDSTLRNDNFDLISADDVVRMSAQVSAYNDEISSQAASFGATTVDFFNTTIFEDWETLSDDGNHPNGAGYDAIAAIWYQAITGSAQTTYRLTVSKAGSGLGTVRSQPSGIECGTDCNHDYEPGTSVELTAHPSSGSTFSGWSGACSGSTACQLTMNSNLTVRGTFDGAGSYDFEYVVPVVVHGPGAENTNWRSSVVCLNSAASTANLQLSMATNSGTLSETATVGPGAILEWPDIVVNLFDADPSVSTAGTLHVAADRKLMITSRTFNQALSGTFGQFLPALTDSDALSGSDRGILMNLKGIGFRSNAGFVNLGSSNIEIRMTLFDSDGAQLGVQKTATVGAGEWSQVNDVFGNANAQAQDIAYALVEIPSGVGSFWAYASVIDDETGDATTIPVLRE